MNIEDIRRLQEQRYGATQPLPLQWKSEYVPIAAAVAVTAIVLIILAKRKRS